jgi:broad specificity phosphatase PhoE
LIYLVRHGQTVFNAERRFQGGVDSPLTPLGEAQARSVGRMLGNLTAGEKDWTLVSSPLGRARQTAAIIHAEMSHPGTVEFDERLREISLGEWDGLTLPEIEKRRGQAVRPIVDQKHRNFTKWWFEAPGGETFDSFFGRAQHWLIEAQARGEKLVVISHGGLGRMIRGAYLKLTQEQMFDLEVPQDAIFQLSGGTIGRIDCEIVEDV